MRLFRPVSIRSKLFAALLIVFVPLGIFIVLSHNQAYKTNLDLLKSSERLSASAAAKSVDLLLEEIVIAGKMAAELPKGNQYQDFNSCAKRVKSSHPDILSAALIDPNLDQPIAIAGAPIKLDPENLSNKVKTGLLVSGLIGKKGDNVQAFAIDMLVAMPQNPKAIIHCEVNSQSIVGAVQRITLSDSELLILDRQNRVIWATDNSRSSSGDHFSPDSIPQDVIYGQAESALSGWRVLSIANPSNLQPATQIWRLGVIGSIAIAALGLLLAWRIGNRISSRTRKLGWGASALAVGDFRRRFTVGSGDELDELAAALNSMAENIEARERDLTSLSAALEGMRIIARTAATSLDLDEILRGVAVATVQVSSARACVIYLLEPDGTLAVKHSCNLGQQYLEKVRWEGGDQWAKKAVINRHSVTATGLKSHSDTNVQNLMKEENLDNLLSSPLIVGKTVLGAITVWSGEKEPFKPLDVNIITMTADHMAAVIQNALLYDKESRIAGTLQNVLLGQMPSRVGTLKLGSTYFTALEEARVGGDIFDVFPLPDGQIAVMIADVSGKGLQASVHTALVKYVLRAYAVENPDDPSRVMEKLNEIFVRQTSIQVFVTIFLAIIDPEMERITICNAGHPPAIMLEPEGMQSTLFYRTGIPVGCFQNAEYTHFNRPFKAGSRLLLCTDGVMEARSGDDEFGIDRLESLMISTRELGAQESVDAICQEVLNFSGDKTSDDIAIVLVEMSSNNESPTMPENS